MKVKFFEGTVRSEVEKETNEWLKEHPEVNERSITMHDTVSLPSTSLERLPIIVTIVTIWYEEEDDEQ